MKRTYFSNQGPMLLFFISLLIVWIWFKDRLFFGGGEVGLTFFDVSKLLRLYRGVWLETGLGFPSVLFLPTLPMFYLISFIPSFNIVWLHQAFFFLMTLSIGMIGMYYLVLEIIGEKNKTGALVTSLFYTFNTYSVSQVFGRFIYAGMLLWAYLPLFLCLFLKWLRMGRYRDLLFITFSLLLFSYMFIQPAYIITLWFSAFLVSLSEYIVSKKERTKVVVRFISIFLLWIFTNIWWIYPYIKVGPSSLSGVESYEFNFSSLRGVSNFFPTKEILLLRQRFFFNAGGPFSAFYSKNYTYILSVTALLVAFLGWLATKGKKYRVHLTIIAVSAWFISKGTNPPFGFITYQFLFSNFPITFLFRNPYEKFGAVWLLTYSIFFGLGTVWLLRKSDSRLIKYLLLFSTLAVSFMLGKYIWAGMVPPKSLKISVPTYYGSLNNDILKDKNDGRVLAMPLIYGEAARYKWGYDGAEPSDYLMDKPTVVRMTLSDKLFDNKFLELYNTPVSDSKFVKLLNEMNITYITFNDDYIIQNDAMLKVEQIKKELAKNQKLQKMGNYGPIALYKNLENKDGNVFDVLGDNPPKISYVKESHERYLVTVFEVTSPYLLVFKSEFNSLWQARIGGNVISSHDLIYDYANSWKVDKMGSYNIEVMFKVWPWE